MNLSEKTNRKFIEEFDVNDWEIETDSGWHDVTSVKKTIPYSIWRVETETGSYIECADTHIMFDENYKEIYAKDCVPNKTKILTKNGEELVFKVKESSEIDNMYDISVNSLDHRFYTNNILSHNTTCAISYILWLATFTSDQTILITANKLKGALEIMKRIRFAYEELPNYIRDGVVEYNKGSLVFENGSTIMCTTTTPDSARGMSISLLYCDEFSYVRPTMAKEFWSSVRPTLAEGGRCIITSTPNNDEDMFAQIWFGANQKEDEYGDPSIDGTGVNGFFAFTAHWSDHPDRDDDWANIERLAIEEERFRREYNCEFLSDDETLINPITLTILKNTKPKFYMGAIRWYDKPKPNKTYLIGLDPALGTGGDFSAIEVFQLPEMVQVAEWKDNKTNIRGQISLLHKILTYISTEMSNSTLQEGDPELYWTVENNSIGEAALVVIEDTGEENFPGFFVHEPRRKGRPRRNRKGLSTTNKTKLSACSRLKSLIESNRMNIKSKALISELKNYIARGASFQAKLGTTDDLVASSLLVVRLMEIIQS